MARPELKYVLSNAVYRARSQGGVVSVEDVRLKDGKGISAVTLRAGVLEEEPLQGLVLVSFEDKGSLAGRRPKKKLAAPGGEELEKELLYTRQQLHSTIEQMETSVEELRSTNEELQSTNEDCRAPTRSR